MKHNETNPRRKRLILCSLTVAAGVLIAWGAAAARGLKPGVGTAMTLRYWSDGCFVSAVLIGGIGALTWVSTTGLFDIFKKKAKEDKTYIHAASHAACGPWHQYDVLLNIPIYGYIALI